MLAKRTSILVIVCRDFTHLLAYFLQAQTMRKYTQNDKHQVCPAYLLLCSIFLHESVFNACFLSLSAALISLGDSSSPPVCFLRRRTNVNNTINFCHLRQLLETNNENYIVKGKVLSLVSQFFVPPILFLNSRFLICQ